MFYLPTEDHSKQISNKLEPNSKVTIISDGPVLNLHFRYHFSVYRYRFQFIKFTALVPPIVIIVIRLLPSKILEFDCGCDRCQHISRFIRLRSCEEWQCFSQRRKPYHHWYMNAILHLWELWLWLNCSLRSFFPACKTGSLIYYNDYEIRAVLMTILVYFKADFDVIAIGLREHKSRFYCWLRQIHLVILARRKRLAFTLNGTDCHHNHAAPCGGTGRPPLESTLNKYVSYSTTNE